MVDVDLELGKIIISATALAKAAAGLVDSHRKLEGELAYQEGTVLPRIRIDLSDAIKVIKKLLDNPAPTGMSMWSQEEIEARYKRHEVAVIEARAYIATHKDVKE